MINTSCYIWKMCLATFVHFSNITIICTAPGASTSECSWNIHDLFRICTALGILRVSAFEIFKTAYWFAEIRFAVVRYKFLNNWQYKGEYCIKCILEKGTCWDFVFLQNFNDRFNFSNLKEKSPSWNNACMFWSNVLFTTQNIEVVWREK